MGRTPLLPKPDETASETRSTLQSTTNCSVVMMGPAGVGRTDVVPYNPAGYNPLYGSWALNIAEGSTPITWVQPNQRRHGS